MNYLKIFLKEMKKLNPSQRDAERVLDSFFKKSTELVDILNNETEEKRKKRLDTWFNGVIKQESVEGLLRELNFGNLKKIADDPEQTICNLTDEQKVLTRFISLIGKRNLSIYEGSEFSYTNLPKPTQNKIYLPKFVNMLPTYEENKSILKVMASIQSAFSRYNFFPEEGSYSQFPNEQYAIKIWSILNYKRGITKLSRQFVGLSKEMGSILRNIKRIYEAAPIPFENNCVGVIENLEQRLVYSIESDEIVAEFVEEEIVSKLGDPEEWTNEDVMRITEEIYKKVDESYGIPEPKRVTIEVNGTEKKEKTINLPKTTGGAYAKQQIFFYNELGDKRRVRLIVKQATGVKNNRIEKLREEKATEIDKITRILESIKPQRVTTQRRMPDGELDEDAVHEMILDIEAGQTPDINVYKTRRVNEREISILLTINQSKLLGKWLPDETRVIDYVRPTAIYLAEAVRTIEDDLAIVGYSSRGNNEAFVNIFKDFEEPQSELVDFRLGLLSPLYKSRTGPSYQYFASYLGERRAKRKIHIDLITELAADEGYTGREAIEDTKEAAALERSRGIEVYGILLDLPEVDTKVSEEDLREIYGSGRYQIVKHFDRLPQQIVNIYRVLTL